MEIEKYKILETDFNGKGVSAQPNPMQKTEEEAKAVFDELVKDVVTPRFNAFVDSFQNVDLTSDKDKPVSDAQKEALDKKVDKELRTGSTEEYKVLSDNNYSDEEMQKVQGVVNAKHNHENKGILDNIKQADIDNWNGGNVLTKDNKTPFIPTAPTHPVTKDYVDGKVLETGAADMTQAIYDPKGKKRDIFSVRSIEEGGTGATTAEEALGNLRGLSIDGYITDYGNIDNLKDGIYLYNGHACENIVCSAGLPFIYKYGIWIKKTPFAEVGASDDRMDLVFNCYTGDFYTMYGYDGIWHQAYIPLTGGTLRGNVKLYNGSVQFTSGDVEGWNSLTRDNLGRTQIRSDNGASNSVFFIEPETKYDTFHFWSGSVKYSFFGEHNKPSGTYTGTSSSVEQKIDTGGIGNLLFLSSEYAFGWVMPQGAVFFRGSSSSAYHITGDVTYENGVLTTRGTSSYYNNSNYEYDWKCV